MSAFQVEDSVIKLLAVWAFNSKYANPNLGDVNKAAKLLWEANSESLEYRYGRGCVGKPPKVSKTEMVKAQAFDAVTVIKQAHCLEYQACEYDGWAGSEAYNVLQHAVNNATTNLDGYEQAPWGDVDL